MANFSSIEYLPNAGRYRDTESKQFVPRSRVLLELDREKRATQQRLADLSQQLINDKIGLIDWQTRTAQTLKDSHLRLSAMASGGRSRMTPRHLGSVGGRLRGEYQRLEEFAWDIYNGSLTEKQLIARSKLYAQSALQTFHSAEKISREQEGRTLAMRQLDPGAKHCKQCPSHATDGWVDISVIVPVGSDCDCRGNCRCTVTYR